MLLLGNVISLPRKQNIHILKKTRRKNTKWTSQHITEKISFHDKVGMTSSCCSGQGTNEYHVFVRFKQNNQRNKKQNMLRCIFPIVNHSSFK